MDDDEQLRPWDPSARWGEGKKPARAAPQISVPALIQVLHVRAHGYHRRIKVTQLCEILGLDIYQHGNGADVAVRGAVLKLIEDGCPLGSEPGGSGGVWWIANEQERQGAIGQLRIQIRAIEHRIAHLEVVPLDDWAPRQPPLF